MGESLPTGASGPVTPARWHERHSRVRDQFSEPFREVCHTDCEINHSCRRRCRAVLVDWKPLETVVRSMTSYDIAANRFLLLGCAGIIMLIVTLLFAALR